MKISVIVCSGEFSDKEGRKGNRVELIAAYADYQQALDEVKSGKVDVSNPSRWGERGICVQQVELT